MLQQSFLALDLPASHFDGVFANAALFHVPSQELPRVLAALRQTLKPGGVLFSSNPRGHGRKGWTAGRYGAFYGLSAWRGHMRAAGFVELTQYYRPAGLPLEQPSWLASVWREPASVPARGALRDRAERTAEGADGQAAFAERLAVGPTRTASRSRIGARAP